MEKELVKALEKLEKLVSDKKIESYSFNSRLEKDGKYYYFDIVESLKDKKIDLWLSVGDVLNF